LARTKLNHENSELWLIHLLISIVRIKVQNPGLTSVVC